MSLSVGMAVSMVPAKTISKEELEEIIKQHVIWKADHKNGKKADLSGYNLTEHNLSGVDLSGANLDDTYFSGNDLSGIDLSKATMRGATMHDVDLTGAILDRIDMEGADIFHSKLVRVHAEKAFFERCTMWDNNYTEAVLSGSSFIYAKLCDGKFESADLSKCSLYLADIGDTNFKKANLRNANLTWAQHCYWADFREADLTDAFIAYCYFSDDYITGSKGLKISIACPEEGSFVAWTKSRDNRIVKLLIPESAERTGGQTYSCRASEVQILDIYDGETECEETVGFLKNDKKTYHKGEVVRAEDFDVSIYHDGGGIHFCFSRAEAEGIQYKEEKQEQ